MSSKQKLIQRAAVSALIPFLAGAAIARADVLANITNSTDTVLFNGSNSSKSLSLPGFFAGTDGGVGVKRALIQFDLSTIPAGSTITGVTLNLTVGQVAGSAGSGVINFGPLRNISLYTETQAWNQSINRTDVTYGSNAFGGSGQGEPANTGDATWNDEIYNATTPANSTPWSVAAGGNWTSTSIALADATSIPGTTNEVVTWSSAALTAQVQSWLDNPSSNNGLLIKNDDETTATDFLAFWGEQGAIKEGNPALEPLLAVSYTGATPEPAGFATLFVVAPALLWRRRKVMG